MPKSPAEPKPRLLIVAHRGASAHAPENTFIAFQKAVEAGADGIEFDVRLAGDGVAVVFHDPSLKRITGRKGKVQTIDSDQLRTADAGSWFNKRYPNRADPAFARVWIPTLRETLDHLGEFNGLLYIELKCRDKDIERLAGAVASEICGSAQLPRIIVKSFKLRALSHMRAICPGVRTAALFAPRVRNLLLKEKNILRHAEEAGAHEISLHYTLATRKLLNEASRRGLEVVIWTADRAHWVRRGAEVGLKAIITNDPAKLIAARVRLLEREEIGRLTELSRKR